LIRGESSTERELIARAIHKTAHSDDFQANPIAPQSVKIGKQALKREVCSRRKVV